MVAENKNTVAFHPQGDGPTAWVLRVNAPQTQLLLNENRQVLLHPDSCLWGELPTFTTWGTGKRP